MNKKNEIEVIKEETMTPTTMIQLAIEKGADLEKLEKLLMLQEKWEAMQAKKAYYEAMAAFKSNPPKIDKDKSVAYGNTKYFHASLGNVTEKINTELSKHGLSASWTTQQNGAISVTCRIVHVKGYGEETTLSANSDTTGSKNAIQAIGSTVTYLQRYTLLSLTGLATYDDDDGVAAGAPVECINVQEQNEIHELLVASTTDVNKFLTWLKVDSVAAIPKKDFNKAKVALQAKLKSKGV